MPDKRTVNGVKSAHVAVHKLSVAELEAQQQELALQLEQAKAEEEEEGGTTVGYAEDVEFIRQAVTTLKGMVLIGSTLVIVNIILVLFIVFK